MDFHCSMNEKLPVKAWIFDIFHTGRMRQTDEPDDNHGQPAPKLHANRVFPSIFTSGFI